MSEPIPLTERERAVFGSMIEYVRERCRNNARDGNQASGNAVSRWMEDWLASQPTESASPPRVPGASAQLAREGVQSGPGQPTQPPQNIAELIETVAYERGYRVGIEAATQACKLVVKSSEAHLATEYDETGQRRNVRFHKGRKQGAHDCITAIRALADKPAPFAARKGD